ncbi:XylR family transcriptional regulator [Rhodopirellula sp. MGV]|uniref:XylR family transcriptional regulator n=1 Tax=Rhodopirellula sp. MGV TaxID=2023130 RepID=UPI000B97A36C|nr:XylR family transcriptional regulator [Rhodopirellula sp. MGV]OYP32392.1 XylR family transcriptional regulator [Rhodopirellula sp. MGV]PNY35991.1 xylose operon transcription regulator XylR [Rhodopirellula baltica]
MNTPTTAGDASAQPALPASNTSRPKVLLLVETTMAFGRGVLEGISRYRIEKQPWSVQLDLRDLMAGPPAWLKSWDGDGIITRDLQPEMLQYVQESGVPTINLGDIRNETSLPSVMNDHGAVGRLAATHLADKGLEHFAFAGFDDHLWSQLRYEGYRACLSERRIATADNIHLHLSDWSTARKEGWQEQQNQIVEWVRNLPRPIGIFACNDFRGQHILEACQTAKVSVPDEIAVLGVDNDHVLCDFCDPPLSSIIPAAERIGYQAALLLDQLMRGEKPADLHLRIPPLGIAERLSTDVLAIDDEDVAAAIQMIRFRACEGLTVSEILKEVPIARSSLERRFRQYLGRSPQAEIRRVQIKRACQLLRDTELSLVKISRLTGFKHAEYFSVVFKREVKQTPGRYREASRAKARKL